MSLIILIFFVFLLVFATLNEDVFVKVSKVDIESLERKRPAMTICALDPETDRTWEKC